VTFVYSVQYKCFHLLTDPVIWLATIWVCCQFNRLQLVLSRMKAGGTSVLFLEPLWRGNTCNCARIAYPAGDFCESLIAPDDESIFLRFTYRLATAAAVATCRNCVRIIQCGPKSKPLSRISMKSY